MSSLNYNLMMLSAALFKRHILLDQLTFETTIFGIPVDNQTFIKTIMCLYYDLHRTQQSKDHLSYLYTIYKNDVPEEDYSFGSELILEYVNAATAAAQLYQSQVDAAQGKKTDSGNGKKNRRKYKEKKSQPNEQYQPSDKTSRKNTKYSGVDVVQPTADPWSQTIGHSDNQYSNQSIESIGDHTTQGKYAEHPVWHLDFTEQ